MEQVTWLPKRFPPNTRLIVTTTPGGRAEALAARDGIDCLALPSLSVDEAEQIAVAVCRRYHHTPHPDVLTNLISKALPDGTPAAGNPLWLGLAIEELNLLDADDFARASEAFEGVGCMKPSGAGCRTGVRQVPLIAVTPRSRLHLRARVGKARF